MILRFLMFLALPAGAQTSTLPQAVTDTSVNEDLLYLDQQNRRAGRTDSGNAWAGDQTFGGQVTASSGLVVMNGITFADGTTQNTASQAVGQSTVTGHALGAVYHNTTARPVFVAVSLVCGSGADAVAYASPTNPPTDAAVARGGSITNPNQDQPEFFFIVLPGNYYKVAAGGCSLALWTEWN